jgi:hypothetical protein
VRCRRAAVRRCEPCHPVGVNRSARRCERLPLIQLLADLEYGARRFEHHMTACLEREVVQGSLELESPSVDRARERKNPAFDHAARGAEVGDPVPRRSRRRKIWLVLRRLHPARLSPSVRRRLTHSG